jgi:hypothetical protein
MVDLLVLTSLDQLLFKLKLYFPFLQNNLFNEEVSSTDPSPSVRLHCLKYEASVHHLKIDASSFLLTHGYI